LGEILLSCLLCLLSKVPRNLECRNARRGILVNRRLLLIRNRWWWVICWWLHYRVLDLCGWHFSGRVHSILLKHPSW
jgi:hypothetical protein